MQKFLPAQAGTTYRPQSLRRTVLGAALFALTLMVGVGCKKGDDPAPGPMGSILVYTQKASTTFDKIEIFVDGQQVGSLTKPYLGTLIQPKPLCGTATSAAVLNIERPVGSYVVEAKGWLNGKSAGSWKTTTQLDATECNRLRLTE